MLLQMAYMNEDIGMHLWEYNHKVAMVQQKVYGVQIVREAILF